MSTCVRTVRVLQQQHHFDGTSRHWDNVAVRSAVFTNSVAASAVKYRCCGPQTLSLGVIEESTACVERNACDVLPTEIAHVGCGQGGRESKTARAFLCMSYVHVLYACLMCIIVHYYAIPFVFFLCNLVLFTLGKTAQQNAPPQCVIAEDEVKNHEMLLPVERKGNLVEHLLPTDKRSSDITSKGDC